MSLDTRLEAIKHRRVELRDHGQCADETDPHRPDMSVWATCDDNDDTKGNVVLTLCSLWGQCQRFAEMTPAEARKLAYALNSVANSVDHAMHDVATSRVELVQQLRDCPENAGRVP